MARGRSQGRGARRTANSRVAPPASSFQEAWLRAFQERQYLAYADLTNIEDRRRYHPERLLGLRIGPAPRSLLGRPRVVIVPEGHRLSRLAPWGGRVPIAKALAREQRKAFDRVRLRSLDYPTERQVFDAHGGLQRVYQGDHLSRRVGFQHPWQVMICIRRKRRKEVIFAKGKAGSGKRKQKRPHRNFWSEVRC